MIEQICKFLIDGVISEEQFHIMYSQIFKQKSLADKYEKIILRNGDKILMPPKELKVEINETENYIMNFPLELTNLDYIRRILDFLQSGLKIFINQIRLFCKDTPNYEQDDTMYLLKWMKKNGNKWIPLM